MLLLLVHTLAPRGPLVLGLDDTLERRRGAKIQAKGIYRDPVRSSHSHMVKASGLRWLSLMLLVPISWAKRVWALPFLTVLAPSERYHRERGQRHKKLTDWARQMFLVVRRWVPERALVVVTDSSFAVITLLWHVRQLPKSHLLHHALAVGCRAVRTGSPAETTAEWSTSPERQAATDLGPSLGHCGYSLAHRNGARLVW